MRILLYSQKLQAKHVVLVQQLLNDLYLRGVEIVVYTPYLSQLNEARITLQQPVDTLATHPELIAANIDFVITLGGDGTILQALMLIRDSGIPTLGINLGRLGFLATADGVKYDDAIDSLLTGNHTVEKRRLLQLECNIPIFGDFPFALNDFTIVKRDTSSMIIVHTYLNGDFLNSYWADGLILSTATGSTGYSLSCGGPIIFPNSGNFVLTPIAPHNLNVRPIVFANTSTVSFEIEGRADNFLCTLDSRFELVTAQHQISLRCADFFISIVRLKDYSFPSTIRQKLSWGLDSRN